MIEWKDQRNKEKQLSSYGRCRLIMRIADNNMAALLGCERAAADSANRAWKKPMLEKTGANMF